MHYWSQTPSMFIQENKERKEISSQADTTRQSPRWANHVGHHF
uniref:Uncharacterized protein n=1 Tax=Triticum urartu TaxID=4572 RepID=A0A8R7R6Z5_TRIUA